MKSKLAVFLSSLVVAGSALAQAKAPEPDYTLSFNVGVVSDYRYRGVSQSRLKPALQGGADFSHKSGFYLGTWASTIRWIDDLGGGANVEVDLYGGYKFNAGPVAMDVGLLRYLYSNTGPTFVVSPNAAARATKLLKASRRVFSVASASAAAAAAIAYCSARVAAHHSINAAHAAARSSGSAGTSRPDRRSASRVVVRVCCARAASCSAF